MISKMLLAALTGIGVGLLVLALFGLAGIRLFEPIPMFLTLVGSAAAIGGAGGLTTGIVARARRGAVKGLLTGVVAGVISEVVALEAAFLTKPEHAGVSNEHAALGTLAIVFFGLVGASVGGPIAAALIVAFRRP